MERHLLKTLIVTGAAACAVLVYHSISTHSVQAQSTPPSTNSRPANATNSTAVWKLMEDYFAALAKNQLPKAAALAPQILAQGTNDATVLKFFSWRIFADRNIRHRDR